MVNYRSFAVSTIGANHLKTGGICQDYTVNFENEEYAIIAVADGHGGDEYSRSDRGARFACECAVSCIKHFLDEGFLFDNLPAADNRLENLQHEIVKHWRKQVKEDLKNDPLVGQSMLNGYGTTLIAVALTQQGWFAVQIGDGKCAVLWDNGLWSQPIPWDRRCFLNATTSLCDSNAAGLFRNYHHTELPAAILIGTDGVDNSYPLDKNDEHLSGFYQKLLDTFSNEGFNEGTRQLQEILPLFTTKGSGDDVSIAGIIR
jgi:hypothetical protein